MQRLSISLRLTIWYAAVSTIGLTIFGAVMWFVLTNSMISWKDRTLRMRASRVEATLKDATSSDAQKLDNKLEEVTGVLPEGEWIRITSRSGQLLFPRSRFPGASGPAVPCGSGLLRDRTVARERFRELCQPVLFGGQEAYLLVSSPLTEDRILLSNFISGLYRMVPILLLVAGLGGYLLSRHALAPVDLIIGEARFISAQDLSRRLTVPRADDQLRRLAEEWNDLLSRIESSVLRITQFTADASHELRSPIAFVRTSAEYHLTTPDLGPELRESFQAILDESTMAMDLLEGLLLLARLDAGEVSSQGQPADVFAVVSEVALHFAPTLQHRRLTLQMTRFPEATLLVTMGEAHLRRVLVAILDNAIKYTPENGSINIEGTLNNGLHLRISDTGVGIGEEYLDRIFDRFFRVDEARTFTEQGVGLGLPIARQLMEQYKGRIAVASVKGRGTSVVLTFPLALS